MSQRTRREHYGLPRPENRIFETVEQRPGHTGIGTAATG